MSVCRSSTDQDDPDTDVEIVTLSNHHTTNNCSCVLFLRKCVLSIQIILVGWCSTYSHVNINPSSSWNILFVCSRFKPLTYFVALHNGILWINNQPFLWSMNVWVVQGWKLYCNLQVVWTPCQFSRLLRLLFRISEYDLVHTVFRAFLHYRDMIESSRLKWSAD